MCFKCCLTLYRRALCIPHEWQHKVAPARLSATRQGNTLAFFLFVLLFSLFFTFSWLPTTSLPLSLPWTAASRAAFMHSSVLPGAQVGILQPRLWQIEIGMTDHMIHRARIPHTRCQRTLTSAPSRGWLAHWLCQCHLMFCLAVSIVRRARLLATWLGPEAWAERGGGNKDSDESSSTTTKPAAPNDVCLKLLCVCVCWPRACRAHASAF